MRTYFNVILVIFIIFLAAIPRSIELLNRNYLWGFDQGEHYLAVKDIVINKNPTFIGTKVGGAGGFFQGPGWYYILSIPFFLSKGDPYAGMVLMFVCSIATVFFSYYFGRKMFGETAGILIAFFVAISPGIIPQSRFIWPPFPITLLSVFYFYSIYKLINGDKKYLPIATFIIGLMSHFEIATSGTLLLQFVLFAPLFFWKRLISLKYLVLSLLSFTLTLSPLIIFDIKNQHLIVKGIYNMIFLNNRINSSFEWTIINHAGVFLNSFKSTFYASEQYWLLFLISFIAGLLLYLKNRKINSGQKLMVIYFFISPFLLFIVFLIYPQGMWEWWILQLPITFCYLFAVFLDFFKSFKYALPLVLLVLIIFLSSFINHTINLYKNDFNDYGGTHKIKGKLDALDYIYKDAKGKPFSIFIFTPPVYPYAYDYLIWWHGVKRYGYSPASEKKGTFYLWIEPDPVKPWSYKGWIETVIKVGKVVKTTTLPSGFIIEKRTN